MTETSTTTDRAVAGRHRAPGLAVTRMTSLDFEPRHCAGSTCTHNHAGGSTPLPRLGRFARLVGAR